MDLITCRVDLSASAELLVYRAMLCLSVVFDVAQCLSVRLSVTFVYCIQTAKDIVKLLSRPGTILVFDPVSRYPISWGRPSAEKLNRCT